MPQNQNPNSLKIAEIYHAQLAREESVIKQKLFRTRAKWGTREVFNFSLTTLVIFLVVFLTLNFQAFAKQFDFWLTQEHTPPTASVVNIPETSETPTLSLQAPEKLKVNSSKKIKTASTLPTLDFVISPVDNRLIIPRLEINAPIEEATEVSTTGDWNEIEKRIQAALHDGVVHFPGSAEPGTRGNAFITGHSSFYPWDSGRYKEVFATLSQIQIGDEVIVYREQKKYVYRVTDTKEVKPEETSVLAPTDDYRLTLMTCTPLGTTLRRFIATAMLVQE